MLAWNTPVTEAGTPAISITTQGYGGKNTLKMAVGIDMDGKITGTKVLAHKETAGLGSKITSDAFQGQFSGKDRGLDGVDNITGATFSSKIGRASCRERVCWNV